MRLFGQTKMHGTFLFASTDEPAVSMYLKCNFGWCSFFAKFIRQELEQQIERCRSAFPPRCLYSENQPRLAHGCNAMTTLNQHEIMSKIVLIFSQLM